MQKLRRLNFFDRHVVKREGAEVHPGIQKLSVWCACGSPEHLWLGDREGTFRRLDRDLVLSDPVQAFDRELVDLRVAQDGARLIALGFDVAPTGGAKYKVFETRRDGEPVQLVVQRVAAARGPELRPTCFAVSSTLSLIAVGLENGGLLLWRGRDLSQDRPTPTVLNCDEHTGSATAVHILEQRERWRTVIFVCSADAIRSYAVPASEPASAAGANGDLRLLHIDVVGGAAPSCSCTFPTLNALLVARSDAIFAYDPDEGNMSAMHLEGEKMLLAQFKSYFVSVTADSSPVGASGVSTTSTMPKQTVTVCLAFSHMRFIAFTAQFTDVTHIVSSLGRIFVLSRGGADGTNTVLFELREKPLAEQLETLVNKRMFEWAAEIAHQGGAAKETLADIYREHGDALFAKRAYDQALAIYTKTVDLALPLEPSYVVEKFLDAQRIAHVAQYLKRLHEKNLAEREHTALLLKCYTKLKDLSTLDEFLERTPVSQYDPATAIEVLETAGYYGLAAAVAQKPEVGRHADFIRISLQHFGNYAKTAAFLRTLPRADACQALLEHGRLLMKHAPQETVDLVRELCGLRPGSEASQESSIAAAAAAASGSVTAPRPHELLPAFLGDLRQLEVFLRGVLLGPGPCPLPPPEAARLFPTLFELLVCSHCELEDLAISGSAGTSGAAAAPGSDLLGGDPAARGRLHADIMRLLRQHQSEDACASALMLSQTYGFVDGFFWAAEKLGRFQLLMSWCFEQRDAKRLLDVCKRCGSMDQSLWVQALAFLCADEGDHIEEIKEVLVHIESSELMPLLMVIETLQQSQSVTVGAVRPYLKGQFKRLVESAESSRGKAKQDRLEIARMQQELVSLRTQAQVFQSTKCVMCGLTLEVPAVHFFCGHSYHAYCFPSDGGCPQCSSEALPKITLREQREAQAKNAEDFFKYLQGSSGDKQIQAIGEWCKFGPFDAGEQLSQRTREDAVDASAM